MSELGFEPIYEEVELLRGYIDSDGNVYRKLILREFTGEEEDILASTKLSLFVKLNKVLANCIKGFIDKDGNIVNFKDKMVDIVRNMSVNDRLYLFLSLRKLSLGDDFSFRITCPICNKEDRYVVKLSELEIKKPSAIVNTYDLDLPSGIKLRMKVMTGVEEEALFNYKVFGDNLLTYTIFVRVLEINGKPPVIDDIKRLPLRDRNYIRSVISDYEGMIDTVVQIRCEHCMNDFNSSLDLGSPDFFFPSGTWKR